MIRRISLIVIIHVLLVLNLIQQVVALLVHLSVFAAIRSAVIIVHLIVIDVITGVVKVR